MFYPQGGGGQASRSKGFGLPLGRMFWKFEELFCYCNKVIYYRLLKCHCSKVQIRYNDTNLLLKKVRKEMNEIKNYGGTNMNKDLKQINNSKGKSGFTLAEVLITLGIIGVVAAMTMPTLISKYKMSVLKNQFKKAYANITNAVNLVQAEYGAPILCRNAVGIGYQYDDCQMFWDEVFKKLSVIKVCDYTDESCGVQYKTRDEVLAEGGEIINDSCSYFAPFSFAPTITPKRYQLSDGSSIIQVLHDTHKSYFALDVNGAKGPNKWGYDVFYLALYANNMNDYTYIRQQVCAIKEKGGYYPYEFALK